MSVVDVTLGSGFSIRVAARIESARNAAWEMSAKSSSLSDGPAFVAPDEPLVLQGSFVADDFGRSLGDQPQALAVGDRESRSRPSERLSARGWAPIR
jgi:hypothetical protein